MKKTLSLLLALVMVIGLFPVFADENPATLTAEEAGALLQGYGAIKGDSNGDLMIDKELKRQDAVVILTRLMGKEADALATPAMTSFTDVAIDYYKPFLAYAEAQKWVEGKGNNLFGFNDVVTVKEFSAILLRALGHDTMGENYAKVMDLAKELKLFNGAMVEENASVVRGIAFILMNNTLETAPKGETKPLKKILGYINANTGALEVSSIKADSAKTIAVSFNREVIEEEAKELKFVVLRGKTEIKVEAKWNNENNMVSLENKNTFAVGDYTVTVMKGEEEFAKQDIKFEQQKVAKIEIMSEDVAVNPQDGKGYVIFRVYDQYEQDISEQHLGNAVTVEIGVSNTVASKDKRNGVITITPIGASSLLTYQQIPVTIYDRTSGVSVTKTLPTASKIGSISEFKFMPEKDVVIIDGDLATTVEIPYEALDQTGQKTTNYELIKDGLIFNNKSDELLTSIAQVKVRVMKDPKDGTKAKIVAQFSGNPVGVNMDLNVIVNALLWNGKNSSMNITLKQANDLHTFRLLNPAQVVAEGDKFFEVPFEALDKEGNRITKFYALNGKVTFNNGYALKEKANGDAVLRIPGPFNENTPVFITSLVNKTANFSQIQVTVQKKHEAKGLYIENAGATNALEDGLARSYTFAKGSQIHVRDQYDRVRDISADEVLLVRALNPAGKPAIISVTGTSDTQVIDSVSYSKFVAGNTVSLNTNAVSAEESLEVQFLLWDTGKSKVIEEKKVRFVVVPSHLITGYDYHPATKAYANANSVNVANLRARDIAYGVDCGVTGRTDSGITNIELQNAHLNYTVGNPNEFVVKLPENKIVAAKPLNNKAESKTNVAVALTHNGNSRAYSYELTGTTELPQAVDIRFNKGIAKHLGDDVYEIPLAEFLKLNDLWLQKFYPKNELADYDRETDTERSSLSFDSKDSYGDNSFLGRLDLTYAMALEEDRADKATVTLNGQLKTLKAKAGDVYRLTASSPKDGVSYTVKLKIVNGEEFYLTDTTTKLDIVKVETLKKPAIADATVDILVTFNRALDKTMAEDKNNYGIGGVNPNSAVLYKVGDITHKDIVKLNFNVAQYAHGKKLDIKEGIKVLDPTLVDLSLAEKVTYTLSIPPHIWTRDAAPAPKMKVVDAKIIDSSAGIVVVEVKFNNKIAVLPAITDADFESGITAAIANATDIVKTDDYTLQLRFTGVANWHDKALFTLTKTIVADASGLMEHNYNTLLSLDGTKEDALQIEKITTTKYNDGGFDFVVVKFNKDIDVTAPYLTTLANFKSTNNTKQAQEATWDATKKELTLKFTTGDLATDLWILNVKDTNTNPNTYPTFKWNLANGGAPADDDKWNDAN